MKNLKKVLALGLALVMMLGMLTIASAAEAKKTAADFPDWASVGNKDAFGLMVDLGVINGTSAGTLAPAANIDRASWAKLVFFVLTGENDGSIYASDYPVLKDISGSWAQGFIEYLYSRNYISGDTSGNYNPGQSINVVAAAKTMLTGLGYNSKIEGYENNANWANNIMLKAKEIGLLKGIDLKQDALMTRDAAAQMVYNALSAKTVTANTTLNFMTGEYVPSGTYKEGVTLAEKAFDIEKVTATVDKVEKGIATLSGVKDADGNAVALPSDAEVKASLSEVGKTVSLWVKTDKKSVVSTSVASAASAPIKVVTGGVDWTKVFDSSDKDNFVADDAETVKYITNGGAATTTQPANVASGNVVEFYTNDDNKVDIVHIYNYTVKKLESDASSKTKDDETTVTIKGICTNLPSTQISGEWASLKSGDVVMYYTQGTGKDATVCIEKITNPVNGKVTGYKADKDNSTKTATITVGGKAYSLSGIVATGDADKFDTLWSDFDNEFDFYLDKNGDICLFDQITDDISGNIAVVVNAWETVTTGKNGGTTVGATLLFTDGTKQDVTVAKVGGTDADAKSAVKVAEVFYNYKVNSKGNYELTEMGDTNAKLSSTTFDGTNAIMSGVTGNNKTVYIVEIAEDLDDDDATYTVYTGYKNMPEIEDGKITTGAVNSKDGIAKYVFVSASQLKGAAKDAYVYITDTGFSYDKADDCNVFSAYDEDGNEISLKVDTSVTVADTGFHKVESVTDAGVYTIAASATAGQTATLKGGVLTVNGEYVAFDEATKILMVTIEDDEIVSVTEVDSSDWSGDYNYTAIVEGDPADAVYVEATLIPVEDGTVD